MAVMSRRRMCAALLAGFLPAPTSAQEDPRRFIEPAHALALFQARLAHIVVGRDARPEIRELATRMQAFRDLQLTELARLAQTNGVPLRNTLDLDLRSILEGLEPLDFLALSRRYAEAATQALDRELTLYEAAANAAPPPLRGYAVATLPKLQDLATAAKQAGDAVRPK